MSDVEPSPARPRDRRLAFLTGIVAVSFIVANIGSISSAAIVKEHPELLLALSSRNRHLLFAVGAHINPVAYAIIPFLRMIPIALAYFLLAFHYGERGRGWYERELGSVPRSIRWAERAFDRVGPVIIIFFAGSQLTWMLAGLRKLPPKRFIAYEVIGIALRLIVIWWLGKRFSSQLTSVLDFIQRNQWKLTILLLVTVVFQTRKTMKKMPSQQG